MYGADPENREVVVDGYRIDAVRDDGLIEVQCASLSAIRSKILDLVQSHDVRVVKPIATRTYLITKARKNGKVVSQRYSPTRRNAWHVFEELVHFVDVFPHPRLMLEVLLAEFEEHRVRRKPRRWRGKDYRVEDRTLRSVAETFTFATADDLLQLLPGELPEVFTTADIAKSADIPRWLAQKAAYCLRKTNAIDCVETRGRLRVYRRKAIARRKRAA